MWQKKRESQRGIKRIRRVLFITLFLNLLVSLLKGIFGMLAGSVSMVADALHSFFDSVSNIVCLITTWFSEKPPDVGHQYGHGKIESFGTLIIGAMLLLTAYWVFDEGFGRLFSDISPVIAPITVCVMLLSLVVNIGVTLYERKVGAEEKSDLLLADAKHTLSDVAVTLSVLAGFVLVQAGYAHADAIIACGIAFLIAKMGFDIIRESGAVLTDAALLDCSEDVASIVASVDGARGYHDFRCRGGKNEIFGDIHISVNPTITVAEGHAIGETVRQAILRDIPEIKDIVIHIDPAYEYHNKTEGEL